MQPQPSGLPPTQAARQPFSWRGVAALATAPSGWLPFWVLSAALVLGWAAERFVTTAWLPAVTTAVRRLPTSGEIRAGRLFWPTNTVTELARTPFLALRVNPRSTPVPGQAADVDVELIANEICAQSLFGYWTFPYPPRLALPLNRPEVEPVWAAWQPYIRAAVFGAGALVGLVSWTLVGLVAAPVVRLLAALLRRQVTLGGCWRLVVAALLPGGLVVAGGLLLYAGHGFRLLDFLVVFVLAHLLGVWLALGAAWQLPRRQPPALFATPEPAATPPAVSFTAVGSAPPGDSPFAMPVPSARPANPFAASPAIIAPPEPPAAPPTKPPMAPPKAPVVSQEEPPEQPLNPS